MVVDIGARGHAMASSNRYTTIVGILFAVAVTLTLLQLTLKKQDLRCGFVAKTQTAPLTQQQVSAISHDTRGKDSSIQVHHTDDDCTDCDSDEEFVIPDSPEWPALNLERQKCLHRIRNRVIEDYRPFFENATGIALIDVALHVNLGDSILMRAAIHLASLFGHSVHYVCAGSQDSNFDETFPRCDMEKLIEVVKNNGLVMYHAGGNWGDLYRHVQKYRLQFLKRLGTAYQTKNTTFKVIQLTQTIAYKPDGMEHIATDDDAINNLPAGMFTLVTRQEDSYTWAKEHYKDNIKILKSPDLAFALGQLSPVGEPTIDVIFVMRDDREDKERGNDLERKVGTRFTGTGLTYSFQDWGYENETNEYSAEHPTLLSEVRLNGALRTISSGKVLITNRFHAHLIGMMMGKMTFWVDTIQEKVKLARDVALNTSHHCTDEAMSSFRFSTTLDAVDAAVDFLYPTTLKADELEDEVRFF